MTLLDLLDSFVHLDTFAPAAACINLSLDAWNFFFPSENKRVNLSTFSLSDVFTNYCHRFAARVDCITQQTITQRIKYEPNKRIYFTLPKNSEIQERNLHIFMSRLLLTPRTRPQICLYLLFFMCYEFTKFIRCQPCEGGDKFLHIHNSISLHSELRGGGVALSSKTAD